MMYYIDLIFWWTGFLILAVGGGVFILVMVMDYFWRELNGRWQLFEKLWYMERNKKEYELWLKEKKEKATP